MAAPHFTVELENLAITDRAFDAVVQGMGAEMTKALWKAGLMVETPAVRAATTKFNHPTGNLPASIHTQVKDAPDHVAIVGTNLSYARIRELGGPGFAWGRPHIFAPRPYLLPAFQEARPKILDVFRKLLQAIPAEIRRRTKSL